MIKEAGEPPTVLGPEEGGGPAAAIPPVLDGLEWLQLQDLSLVVGGETGRQKTQPWVYLGHGKLP